MKIDTGQSIRIISRKKQVEDWEELWKNPYVAPYTLCISSTPTEVRAQMVAMRMFLRAIAWTRKFHKEGVPRWHNVISGWGHDELRDGPLDYNINFLVLGNVVENSTGPKIEKLRDIITRYSNIPKIVVTADVSPVDFMANSLKMPIHFALNLGSRKKTVNQF